MTEEVLKVWRVVVLAGGAFDIGMVLFVVYAYLRGAIKPAGPYRKTWHVVTIATSYLLLAGALWAVIAGRAIAGTGLTWRLPVATAAYGLGLFALSRLIHHTRPKKGGT